MQCHARSAFVTLTIYPDKLKQKEATATIQRNIKIYYAARVSIGCVHTPDHFNGSLF